MSKHIKSLTGFKVWDNPFFQAAGENRDGNLNWPWCVEFSTHPYICTFSTLVTMKGHCRADQYLVCGSSGGAGGVGNPRVTRRRWALVPQPHTMLWGGLERGWSYYVQVNEEGGQTTWENNTGKLFPCFFGTFQNSLIKKVYKGSTPLKNYSFKYLQK